MAAASCALEVSSRNELCVIAEWGLPNTAPSLRALVIEDSCPCALPTSFCAAVPAELRARFTAAGQEHVFRFIDNGKVSWRAADKAHP